MKLPIYQVDAFSDSLFQGNPAAVVPLSEWLEDSVMQSIASENNLAETAFFIPKGPGFQLRWFTPAVEVDLCGHATLASAHVLFQHLGFEKEEIAFQSRSGILKVRRDNDWYVMDFPADEIQRVTQIPKAVTAGLGFSAKEVYKGRDDYMVVVETQTEVEQLNPDFRALLKMQSRGLIVTAPGDSVDFVSRCFFPPAGIDEDPVTGSAHTTMTPFWAAKLGKSQMVARQLSRRGGLVKCVQSGSRVKLGGQAVTYLQGEIML